jgi:hypothetical protein
MTLEEKRARDAARQRERRARAKVAQIPHPERAPEADLPGVSVLWDLITQASRAAERRGLRLMFSLAAGPHK